MFTLPENAGELLQDFISKIKHPFWVSAGTALGLYRDKDFIQGDTDLDIAMIGHVGIENVIKLWLADYRPFREVYVDDKVMQLAFEKDDVVYDIYFHWPSEDGKNYINIAGYGMSIMPKRIYDNPVIIETKYGFLPFPNKPGEYFTIRYGQDWEVKQEKKPFFFPIPAGTNIRGI